MLMKVFVGRVMNHTKLDGGGVRVCLTLDGASVFEAFQTPLTQGYVVCYWRHPDGSDLCYIQTEDDLIGWASCVHTESGESKFLTPAWEA